MASSRRVYRDFWENVVLFKHDLNNNEKNDFFGNFINLVIRMCAKIHCFQIFSSISRKIVVGAEISLQLHVFIKKLKVRKRFRGSQMIISKANKNGHLQSEENWWKMIIFKAKKNVHFQSEEIKAKKTFTVWRKSIKNEHFQSE